jgi:hypothetical protein
MVLRDLQRVLDMPRQQLGQCDVDALLLSATLLSIVAFALPSSENEPKTSWVFSNREDRLGWLGLQIGLRPLLLSMTTFIENTLNLLSPIFFGGKKFNRASHDLEKVPQHWKEFLELDDSASGDCDTQAPHDVFRAPISIIMQLRELEPIPSNLFKNLQFLGKVQQEFRALLLKSNNKALWLFGYWLGIMCRYKDVWWCEARSRRDHEAICLWLKQVRVEERPGREGEMWTRMMEELLMVPIWEPVS